MEYNLGEGTQTELQPNQFSFDQLNRKFMLATEPFQASSELLDYLIEGNEQACRQMLDRLREDEGASLLKQCETITEAFHRIGSLWECSELEVYREHIATQIGYRLLLHLRSLLPDPDEGAPAAIGCAPEGDPYTLSTLMVEVILRDLGYRAQSLGNNLPLQMLAPALDRIQPRLCWVSVSSMACQDKLQAQLRQLSDLCESRSVRLICGGRAANKELRSGLEYVHFLDTLSELDSLATNGRS